MDAIQRLPVSILFLRHGRSTNEISNGKEIGKKPTPSATDTPTVVLGRDIISLIIIPSAPSNSNTSPIIENVYRYIVAYTYFLAAGRITTEWSSLFFICWSFAFYSSCVATGRGRVKSLAAETDGLIIFVPFRILAGIPLPVVIVWAIVKANWFTYTSNETHVSPSPSLVLFLI